MRVVVTGANGFIGGHVCTELLRRGFTVRALVRRQDAAIPVGTERVVVPDLADPGPVARAVGGADAVVHLAGRAHVLRDRSSDPLAEFRRANVEATRCVARAAAAAGARRFILASSVKVNGEGADRPYAEADAPNPADAYGRSKREAEECLGEVAGLDWTILRPPLVYGPGVRGNFRRLLSLASLSRRLPLPLGGIPNRRSLLFVGNLADAVVHLLSAEGVACRHFLISDGEDVSTSELIRRLAVAAGGRARLAPCPVGWLRGAARIVGRAADADRLLGSLTVDASALRSTGWAPPTTLDDGLRRTVQWWEARGRSP